MNDKTEAYMSDLLNNPFRITSKADVSDICLGGIGVKDGIIRFYDDVWGYRAATKLVLQSIGEGYNTPVMILSILKKRGYVDTMLDVDLFYSILCDYEYCPYDCFPNREIFNWFDVMNFELSLSLIIREARPFADDYRFGLRFLGEPYNRFEEIARKKLGFTPALVMPPAVFQSLNSKFKLFRHRNNLKKSVGYEK